MPDFLEEFIPADEALLFDDDTDREDEEAADAAAGEPYREYGEAEFTTFKLGNTSGQPGSGDDASRVVTEQRSNSHGMVASRWATTETTHDDMEASQWAPTETAGEPSW